MSDELKKGLIFTPPNNPGTFIGKAWRAMICKALTCAMNPKIIALIGNSGISPTGVEADIKLSQNGWTATLDLTQSASAGAGQIGQLVYVRACLADGTVCYVPISVQGIIYRNPGTGTTNATINSGSVPTGSTVII